MENTSKPLPLVLGSSSIFRKQILEKLGCAFHTGSPDVDETEHTGESAESLVMRLAEMKARAVAKEYPQALIIGSDQVACVDNEILGKPGTTEKAQQQLQKSAGKVVTFYTGLCLYNSATDSAQVLCEPFKVHFRPLSDTQISRYIEKEQPLNCAGSFKSEGLGITLFSKLEGDDPNTLIGLPLIQLVAMLQHEGMTLP